MLRPAITVSSRRIRNIIYTTVPSILPSLPERLFDNYKPRDFNYPG